MEYAFIIAMLYISAIIIQKYIVRRDLKYDKRRNWLYKVGLIETFIHTRRH